MRCAPLLCLKTLLCLTENLCYGSLLLRVVFLFYTDGNAQFSRCYYAHPISDSTLSFISRLLLHSFLKVVIFFFVLSSFHYVSNSKIFVSINISNLNEQTKLCKFPSFNVRKINTKRCPVLKLTRELAVALKYCNFCISLLLAGIICVATISTF